MTDSLKQTIQEELAEIPKANQLAIASIDWLKIAEDIGQEFNLEEEGVESLQLETLLVLTNVVDMEFFAINIENHVETSTEMAKNIADAVSQRIFKPILEKFPKNTETKIGENVILPNQIINPNIVNTSEAKFDKLPKDISDIMRDSNFQSTLYGIAQMHKLSVTQMGTLDTLTTKLITGAIRPNEFRNALVNELKMSAVDAVTLENEINEKIFRKIREKMMNRSIPTPEILDVEIKNDLEVLKSHGIDILPQEEKIEINAPKQAVHPILVQKMNIPVKNVTTKSSYGLNNVPLSTGEVKPPVPPSSPKPQTYSKNADPYRTPID